MVDLLWGALVCRCVSGPAGPPLPFCSGWWKDAPEPGGQTLSVTHYIICLSFTMMWRFCLSTSLSPWASVSLCLSAASAPPSSACPQGCESSSLSPVLRLALSLVRSPSVWIPSWLPSLPGHSQTKNRKNRCGYVFTLIWLFVCKKDKTKTTKQIPLKGCGISQGRTFYIFGPDPGLDPGFICHFLSQC